jgi:4-hydroxy-3-polyprenylbenzoate decarboxylase
MELVVGITGASGVQYGIRLLEVLAERGVTTHLIVSDAARKLIALETDVTVEAVESIASFVYDDNDFTAPIASGSHRHNGMVVVPCTMKTLASLAQGVADTLIARAGDVCLKESRRLILVPRETPLNLVHLQNMMTLKQAGAHIVPASPAFYHKPSSISELVDFMVGRVLDLLDIEHDLYKRWG